jgi:hypothetical protein
VLIFRLALCLFFFAYPQSLLSATVSFKGVGTNLLALISEDNYEQLNRELVAKERSFNALKEEEAILSHRTDFSLRRVLETASPALLLEAGMSDLSIPLASTETQLRTGIYNGLDRNRIRVWLLMQAKQNNIQMTSDELEKRVDEMLRLLMAKRFVGESMELARDEVEVAEILSSSDHDLAASETMEQWAIRMNDNLLALTGELVEGDGCAWGGTRVRRIFLAKLFLVLETLIRQVWLRTVQIFLRAVLRIKLGSGSSDEGRIA